MNGKYILKVSPSFYEDLNDVILYIMLNLNNSISAKNFIIKLEKEINKRLQNPVIYVKYKTNKNEVYYRINVGNYSVFYTVEGNIMILGRIIYSRREFENLL